MVLLTLLAVATPFDGHRPRPAALQSLDTTTSSASQAARVTNLVDVAAVSTVANVANVAGAAGTSPVPRASGPPVPVPAPGRAAVRGA
jgi:hypothetical protein